MCAERELVTTKTGEIFQPIRLFYRIKSRTGVRVAFNKLRCVDYEGDHWVWVYDNEAKKLDFVINHSAIHSDDKPLILGIFSADSDNKMHLDVGSIDRALTAITFFGRHIKKQVAEIEYVSIYNKLPANRNGYPGLRYDVLFSDVDVNDFDGMIATRAAKFKRAFGSGLLEDELNKVDFDLIEAFRVRNDEEGLALLGIELRLRQGLAMARWKGIGDFGISDLIKSFANVMEFGKPN